MNSLSKIVISLLLMAGLTSQSVFADETYTAYFKYKTAVNSRLMPTPITIKYVVAETEKGTLYRDSITLNASDKFEPVKFHGSNHPFIVINRISYNGTEYHLPMPIGASEGSLRVFQFIPEIKENRVAIIEEGELGEKTK